MPVYADPVGGVAIRAGSLTTWNADLVERLGTPTDIAADVAVVVVASDRRGIASHGTARLARCAALIEQGTVDPRARPERVRARPAIALFDREGRPAITPDEAFAGALVPLIAPMGLEALAERYGVPLPEATPLQR